MSWCSGDQHQFFAAESEGGDSVEAEQLVRERQRGRMLQLLQCSSATTILSSFLQLSSLYQSGSSIFPLSTNAKGSPPCKWTFFRHIRWGNGARMLRFPSSSFSFTAVSVVFTFFWFHWQMWVKHAENTVCDHLCAFFWLRKATF